MYRTKLELKWDWRLFRKWGWRRTTRCFGYWTDWYTPIFPGLYIVYATEGPP